MKKAIALIGVLALASVAVSQRAETQHEPGMYADQNGTQVKLTSAQFTGVKSKNSIVRAQAFWTFRGSAAQVQLSNSRPRFLLYGATKIFPADQIVIVALDSKKDHRELKIASGSMFGGHGGFDPETTVTTTVTKRDDETWEVYPDKELKPGEYLITTEVRPDSGQRSAFDLSIQPAPK
jgi:hypothetical protein